VSWKDRIPGLGEVPQAPQPIPGPLGPDDPDYRRLAAAEDDLRNKLMGLGRNAEKTEKPEFEQKGFAREAVISGLILLALTLCLEYLV